MPRAASQPSGDFSRTEKSPRPPLNTTPPPRSPQTPKEKRTGISPVRFSYPSGLSLLLSGFLLTSNRTFRPLTRTSIGLRPLSTNRQPAPMTQPTIAANIGQTLDMSGDLTAKVAFDLHSIDSFTKLVLIFARHIFNPHIRANAGLSKQLLRRRKSDAEDVRKSDLDAFVARKIDAGNTSHELPLNLFVLRIDAADHADFAFAANDFAAIAHCFNGRTDFHTVSFTRLVLLWDGSDSRRNARRIPAG